MTLEDILHEQGHTHSKSDYYPGHLFIRVLSHTLGGEHYYKRHISLHHHANEEHNGQTHDKHSDYTQSQIPDATVPPPKNPTGRYAPHPVTSPDESLTDHLPKLDLEGGGAGIHAQDLEGRESDDSIDKLHIDPSPPTTATPLEDGSDAKKNSKGKDKSKESNVRESEHETAHPHIKKMLGQVKSHLSLGKRMTALSGFGGPVSFISTILDMKLKCKPRTEKREGTSLRP